jgi:hypothetical protein
MRRLKPYPTLKFVFVEKLIIYKIYTKKIINFFTKVYIFHALYKSCFF